MTIKQPHSFMDEGFYVTTRKKSNNGRRPAVAWINSTCGRTERKNKDVSSSWKKKAFRHSPDISPPIAVLERSDAASGFSRYHPGAGGCGQRQNHWCCG